MNGGGWSYLKQWLRSKMKTKIKNAIINANWVLFFCIGFFVAGMFWREVFRFIVR